MSEPTRGRDWHEKQGGRGPGVGCVLLKAQRLQGPEENTLPRGGHCCPLARVPAAPRRAAQPRTAGLSLAAGWVGAVRAHGLREQRQGGRRPRLGDGVLSLHLCGVWGRAPSGRCLHGTGEPPALASPTLSHVSPSLGPLTPGWRLLASDYRPPGQVGAADVPSPAALGPCAWLGPPQPLSRPPRPSLHQAGLAE